MKPNLSDGNVFNDAVLTETKVHSRVADAATGRWWEDETKYRYRIAGTFEGGGAKGAAYVGALTAVSEADAWFSAVAGASAGALTACLVAAGCTPEKIREYTTEGLGLVKTWKPIGIARLWVKAGFFPQSKFLQWLDKLLIERVHGEGSTVEESVTFRQLYDSTGIELNVVAANLSLQRQIVFSHIDTPDCQVADAVVASCSIPFAFRTSELFAESPGGNVYRHTIVDGGVWSNFPLWIFSDPAYRCESERTDQPDADAVVGFLLHEIRPQENVKILKFRRPQLLSVEKKELTREELNRRLTAPALEWRMTPEHTKLQWKDVLWFPISASLWLMEKLSWLLLAFTLALLIERGRWPAPKRRVWRRAAAVMDNSLRILSSPISGLFVLLGLYAALYLVGRRVLNDVSGATDPFHFVALTYVMYTIPILGLLLTLLILMAANSVLAASSRRPLYGLGRTYISAPGAPAWADKWPNVIAIPIPETVGTLRFDMPPEEVEALEEAGHKAVSERLVSLLPEQPSTNGDRVPHR